MKPCEKQIQKQTNKQTNKQNYYFFFKLQIDSSGLFRKVNNIKVLTSNIQKFVGTHTENFQFLSGTLFTLLSEVFLDFGNTSVWF